MTRIRVIGGGLAGSEAAWQAALLGAEVLLHEMRPHMTTPAHHTAYLAELVCSNSLKSEDPTTAAGLLKEELRLLDSIILAYAHRAQVPAGGALAVDRNQFAELVTEKIQTHPRITVVREEITSIDPHPDDVTVIASGPLTSPPLAAELQRLTGNEHLYFYDAAAPIVTRESLNMDRLFWGSRYGRGEADYLNAPMDEQQYLRFWEALVNAQRHELKEFEDESFFEGCMPIEVLAVRGKDTLAFGPLRPVGLNPPGWTKTPYAVVQLRIDNKERTLFNLVGFQTNLKWGEQERVFRLIPGLERAEFVRYGVMHRNIYIDSPRLLAPTAQLKAFPRLFVAGQLSGVEGYIESTASGALAGINAALLAQGVKPLQVPETTMLGALMAYITYREKRNFQPMNATFGLLPPLAERVPKKKRRQLLAKRALERMRSFSQVIRKLRDNEGL